MSPEEEENNHLADSIQKHLPQTSEDLYDTLEEIDIMDVNSPEAMKTEKRKAEVNIEQFELENRIRRDEYISSPYDRYYTEEVDNDLIALDESKFSQHELASIFTLATSLQYGYSQEALRTFYGSIIFFERLPRKLRSVFMVLAESDTISVDGKQVLDEKIQLIDPKEISHTYTVELPEDICHKITDTIREGCIESNYTDIIETIYAGYDVYNDTKVGVLNFRQRRYVRMVVQLLPRDQGTLDSLSDMESSILKPTMSQQIHGNVDFQASGVEAFNANPLLQRDIHRKLELMLLLSGQYEEFNKTSNKWLQHYFSSLLKNSPDLNDERNLLDLLHRLPSRSDLPDNSDMQSFISTIRDMKGLLVEKKSLWKIMLKKENTIWTINTQELEDKMLKIEEELKKHEKIEEEAMSCGANTHFLMQKRKEFNLLEPKRKKVRLENYQISAGIMRTNQEQQQVSLLNQRIKRICTFFGTLQELLIKEKSLPVAITGGLSSLACNENKDEISKFSKTLQNDYKWFFDTHRESITPLLSMFSCFDYLGLEKKDIITVDDQINAYYLLMSYQYNHMYHIAWKDSKEKIYVTNNEIFKKITSDWLKSNRINEYLEKLRYLPKYGFFHHKSKKYLEDDIQEKSFYQDRCLANANNDGANGNTVREGNNTCRPNELKIECWKIARKLGHKRYIANHIKNHFQRRKDPIFVNTLFTDEWIGFLEKFFIVGPEDKKELNMHKHGTLYCKINMDKNVLNLLEGNYNYKKLIRHLMYDLNNSSIDLINEKGVPFINTLDTSKISVETADRIRVFTKGLIDIKK